MRRLFIIALIVVIFFIVVLLGSPSIPIAAIIIGLATSFVVIIANLEELKLLDTVFDLEETANYTNAPGITNEFNSKIDPPVRIGFGGPGSTISDRYSERCGTRDGNTIAAAEFGTPAGPFVPDIIPTSSNEAYVRASPLQNIIPDYGFSGTLEELTNRREAQKNIIEDPDGVGLSLTRDDVEKRRLEFESTPSFGTPGQEADVNFSISAINQKMRTKPLDRSTRTLNLYNNLFTDEFNYAEDKQFWGYQGAQQLI